MTLNLPLLYFVWTVEYCQTSSNKNKSRNLWHVTSILVCCIFDEGDAYISYILDVLFLSFNKCWPTLFLAHFIILEVQLSESSFHILLYLFILLNSILFFTLPWKRWKNGIHDRSCIFDAKPKNFLSLNGYWISHYLSTIFLTSLGVFFAEFRITTAHCWTVYCDFVLFFQCRAKLTLQYLSETFYFSVIFEWLPDYSWHLLIFFPLFSFHLTLFFFHHFLLESSAIHRFRNQLYFPGKSLLGIIC